MYKINFLLFLIIPLINSKSKLTSLNLTNQTKYFNTDILCDYQRFNIIILDKEFQLSSRRENYENGNPSNHHRNRT